MMARETKTAAAAAAAAANQGKQWGLPKYKLLVVLVCSRMEHCSITRNKEEEEGLSAIQTQFCRATLLELVAVHPPPPAPPCSLYSSPDCLS